MNREEEFLLNLTRQAIEDTPPDLSALTGLDMTRLLQTAYRHRLFCLLHSWVLPAVKGGAFYPQFQTLWVIESQNRSLLRSEVKAVAGALDEHQIPYILIKGLMQEQLLYGGKPLRDTGDIDLIVLPEDRKRTYQVLKTLDYLQPDNPDGELRDTVSRHIWETGLYKNAEQSVTLELKTGSSALRKNFSRMFEHTREAELDGVKVRTLNEAATLVHLFANAHEANEARATCKDTVLREYFETLLLLRRIGFSEELTAIADKMEAKHKIYEVLRSLDDLYGLTEAEKQAAEQFRPEHCRYPLELDGWSNKSEDMNAGLLFDPFKPHAQARLFDSDYAFHLYGQALKNAVFNKPVYKHRHLILQPGAALQTFPYEGREGIEFAAAWQGEFVFQIRINQNLVTEEEIREGYVSLFWYERDLTRPNIRSSITLRLGNDPGGDSIEIDCINFFKTPRFRTAIDKIRDHYRQFCLPVSVHNVNSLLFVQTLIPVEMLPVNAINPTMVCELSVALKKYSYGGDTVAFSFNLYGDPKD